MDNKRMEELYKPFELKERKGLGGMTFKYVPANDVIDRMNTTFEGCWSTEVVSEKREEDFVVVRVRVTVYDEEKDKTYVHEGYGSSLIARYASGQNSGQVIDYGNAYKSAESKAIKNACTRFGVGLYLESDVEYTTNESDYNNRPNEAVVGVNPPTQTKPVSNPKSSSGDLPPMPPPVADSKRGELSLVPKESNPTPPPAGPETESEPKTKGTTSEVAEPADTPPFPEAKNDGGESSSTEGVTDVQKVAIQGFLQMSGTSFKDLVEQVLEREDNLPKSIEELSYKDAVTLIKHSNDLNKKK